MELRVQWSVSMDQWLHTDQVSFRKWIGMRLRQMLGEEIIKALGEGWLACSAVTESEFDSIRHADEHWGSYAMPSPVETSRLWPPRRVFLLAVNMERATIDPWKDALLLPLSAVKPPPALYDEFSPMPWATDVWKEMAELEP